MRGAPDFADLYPRFHAAYDLVTGNGEPKALVDILAETVDAEDRDRVATCLSLAVYYALGGTPGVLAGNSVQMQSGETLTDCAISQLAPSILIAFMLGAWLGSQRLVKLPEVPA